MSTDFSATFSACHQQSRLLGGQGKPVGLLRLLLVFSRSFSTSAAPARAAYTAPCPHSQRLWERPQRRPLVATGSRRQARGVGTATVFWSFPSLKIEGVKRDDSSTPFEHLVLPWQDSGQTGSHRGAFFWVNGETNQTEHSIHMPNGAGVEEERPSSRLRGSAPPPGPPPRAGRGPPHFSTLNQILYCALSKILKSKGLFFSFFLHLTMNQTKFLSCRNVNTILNS